MVDATLLFPGAVCIQRTEQSNDEKDEKKKGGGKGGRQTLTKLPPGPPLVAAGADLGTGYIAGGALVVMDALHTDVLLATHETD